MSTNLKVLEAEVVWLAPADRSHRLDKWHAGPAVAARFLNTVERIARLLTQDPGFGTPTTKGRGTFPLKIFP